MNGRHNRLVPVHHSGHLDTGAAERSGAKLGLGADSEVLLTAFTPLAISPRRHPAASAIEDAKEREYRAGSEKMGPVARESPADPGGHA
jgi:hypothetical protein